MKIKFAKVLQLAPLETDHRPVYNQQGGPAPHLQDSATKWPPSSPQEDQPGGDPALGPFHEWKSKIQKQNHFDSFIVWYSSKELLLAW